MSLEKDEILAELPGGKLVLAVSGGVDSIVMLDYLAGRIDAKRLIVAHVDHGMRKTSDRDTDFVEALTHRYGLKFYKKKLELGMNASEENARSERYKFLSSVKTKTRASAVLTAHHSGDVVETMIMNLLRGTGRRGLASLKNHPELVRPLLGVSKQEIYDYQIQHDLEFIEDESNVSTRYRRNQIRLELLPRMRQKDKRIDSKLLKLYEKFVILNQEIDNLVEMVTKTVFSDMKIHRDTFRALPKSIRNEVIIQIFRSQEIDMMNIKKGGVERTDKFIVSALPAKKYNPTKQIYFNSFKDVVCVELQS